MQRPAMVPWPALGLRWSMAGRCSVLRLAPRYRLPETTRRAHRACREGLLG
ncbi:hypothetical protein [Kribbella sp. VKM Ac-2571]|uniref:hypothetical protein n=1 Tax=Kribbella sp. VKM Ac-2571 TaxID=2512222 RepID=UPI00192DF662|nr:hypothetical protein [Kribbella sp. VKM Ac-2571]